MQKTVPVGKREPASHLRCGIHPQPKRLSMLALIRLHPSGVIDLTELRLRSNPNDMSEMNHIRRDTRSHIDPIKRKSLISIKIHVVAFHTEQHRRIEQ